MPASADLESEWNQHATDSCRASTSCSRQPAESRNLRCRYVLLYLVRTNRTTLSLCTYAGMSTPTSTCGHQKN